MKKYLVILLTFAVIMAAGTCVRAETVDEADPNYVPPEIFSSGDYNYTINEDQGTITIAEYTGDENEINIPSEIDGYQVTDIGYQAFTYLEMKSVSFPEGIHSIGQRAFEYCVISDTLKLPENVTIMNDAFSYAILPAQVTIPADATVEKCAFSYCDTIEQVYIEDGTVIKSRAFGYCEELDRVVCADGTRLETKAFEYCDHLGEVILCGDVKTEEEAFSYCGNIEMTRVEAVEYDNLKTSGSASESPASVSGVLSGGWEVTEDSSVTEEARAVFDQAMPDHDRVDYDAVALLATQVVAGTNYCFLRRTNVIDSDEKPSYQLVYIWQDPQGDAHVLEVKEITFGLSGDVDVSPDDPGEKELEIIDSPVSQDGVTVTLGKATAETSDTGGFEYSFSGTIENNTDEGIMQVIYTFALMDENGEEFRSFGEVYDGEEEAIPPHTTIEFSHEGIKWGPQSIPAAVSIGISSVKTETELPPAHIPQTGEYLYQALGDEKLENIKKEPPVELSFHIDQGGYGRTAVFKEGEALDQAVELLCGIRIGEESGEWVTDNYNWIDLMWEDGSYTGISLNLRNLEYWVHSTPHTYDLENLDEFWSYASEYLEEDE